MFSKPYLWHPIFVHFSVALLVVGSVFYFLAIVTTQSRYRETWMRYGRWNLWLGLGFTVLTVGFGFVAYYTVPHGEAAHQALQLHRNLALAAAALYAVLGVWSYRIRNTAGAPGKGFASGLVLALALLVTAAFAGGELVFRYGLGVAAPPSRDTRAEEVHEDPHNNPRHRH